MDENQEKPQFRRDLNVAPRVIPSKQSFDWNAFLIELFTFSGCTGRLEFTIIMLALNLFCVIPALLFWIIGTETLANAWFTLSSLATLIPMLAVTARRLHDTGKTGFLMLVTLIPIAGPIVLLIMLYMPPDDSMNNPYVKR